VPVHQVSAPADGLSGADKRRIAAAITAIHVDVTAAPAEFGTSGKAAPAWTSSGCSSASRRPSPR
jgi:hypothetical protein